MTARFFREGDVVRVEVVNEQDKSTVTLDATDELKAQYSGAWAAFEAEDRKAADRDKDHHKPSAQTTSKADQEPHARKR